MKIWKLFTNDYTTAHLFSINTKEQEFYTDILNTFYSGEKVAPNWQPTMVCNSNDADIAKIISAGKEYWIVSEKAKLILEAIIKHSLEWLPLYSKNEVSKKISPLKQVIRKKNYAPVIASFNEQKLYLLNVLDCKAIETINMEASIFDYKKKENIFQNIEKLIFHKKLIKSSLIFTIDNPSPYFSNTVFVSDGFRKFVQKHNLSGLNFIPKPEDEGGNLVWEN